MPLTVWLVRHGQSTANAGLPSANHADVALTPLGEEQALEVALEVNVRPALLAVSPFLRARATAQPILQRWEGVPVETWPIEEFSYLSPERCRDSTLEMRRPWVRDYWERADPHHVDGPGAESFAQFMQRLRDFRGRLAACGDGLVVAVGHGQFFRAFLWGDATDYRASAESMGAYRAAETAQPMRNGEIIVWRPGAQAGGGGLDFARALAFMDGETSVLDDLLAVFLKDAAAELAAYEVALATVDRKAILKYLHRIVPTLAIIGTPELHAQADGLYRQLHAVEGAPSAHLALGAQLAAAMHLALAQGAAHRAQLSR